MTKSKGVENAKHEGAVNAKHIGAEYASLPDDERIMKISRITIRHSQFKHVLRTIEECHNQSKLTTEPRSLFVTGEPGSGKSTIFENYSHQHLKIFEDETSTHKNILAVRLQSPMSIGAFVEKLLEEIGDPRPTFGKTVGEKLNRLIKYIKALKVELIMLDEFHNLFDPKKRKAMYDVADCFKTLINDTKVPCILFGLKEASHEILNSNKQLFRRFIWNINLDRFGYRTKRDKDMFYKLLSAIDDRLPFEEQSCLADPDLASKIFVATDGLIFSIMALIQEAAKLAISQKKEKIELHHFEQAFDENYFLSNERSNPFLDESPSPVS